MLPCARRMTPLQFEHLFHGRTTVILTVLFNTAPANDFLVNDFDAAGAVLRKKKMNLVGKIKQWRSYRRTVNELSALSNRELDDLGISRADIPFVARRAR